MIKYKIDNIRSLIGPKVNLQMVYDNPVCRLDTHSVWESNMRKAAIYLLYYWAFVQGTSTSNVKVKNQILYKQRIDTM